ncbi:DUF2971 domain-containing protein [Methanosarcina sp. 1.H.A.2.2]|uniref:DUF2971 domain-containing protein n=1 Tax=Methanosarcina sp. 1.H.A.2.2 TaxID=1483601 RepID=UPI0006225178|nr:DUF2971 domain-containing protein [Methanosarcina sp. 1.H.A.2.2]KKH45723.1 hypothetical protein EO93_02325 [Methanosarcina sp. 1.H.A.2.2]
MTEIDSSNVFFKYRKINKNTLHTLINNELIFSSPFHFNDPFDTIIDLFFEGTEEDFEFFLGDDYTEEDFEYFYQNQVKKVSDERFRLIQQKENDKHYNDRLNLMRVLCLSQKKDEILMWSHYANDHKGICLCFEAVEKDGDLGFYFDSNFLPLLEIEYSDIIPAPINMFEPNMEGFLNFFTTKHSSWSYEKEYRLIDVRNDFENHNHVVKKFDKKSLVGVIFGLNTSIEDLNQIYKCLKTHYIDKGFNVQMYKCFKAKGKYAVDIQKIDVDFFIESEE